MNILFVSSGNNKFGISPIVFSQGESLKKNGVQLDYYTIKGKGIFGYLKNIPEIKKVLDNKNYNLIHAHYSLSAITVSLTFTKSPIIVSLMGSDSNMNLFWRLLIKFNYWAFWKKVIVKSVEMKKRLDLKRADVIPNGVDLSLFKPADKKKLRQHLRFSDNRKYVLFLANPQRIEKNYPLAQKAVHMLNDNSVILKTIFDIEQQKIVDYLNACDILILSSLWEGSPNVIKEALSCNVPIVATDVGDVKWLLDDLDGCFVSSSDPGEFAKKVRSALDFSEKIGRTKGRNRIIKLGLDSESVAQKIKSAYEKII